MNGYIRGGTSIKGGNILLLQSSQIGKRYRTALRADRDQPDTPSFRQCTQASQCIESKTYFTLRQCFQCRGTASVRNMLST